MQTYTFADLDQHLETILAAPSKTTQATAATSASLFEDDPSPELFNVARDWLVNAQDHLSRTRVVAAGLECMLAAYLLKHHELSTEDATTLRTVLDTCQDTMKHNVSVRWGGRSSEASLGDEASEEPAHSDACPSATIEDDHHRALLEYHGRIAGLDTMDEYVALLQEMAHQSDGFKLHFKPFNLHETCRSDYAVVNTHQDTRDVERDIISVNDDVLVGSELGYSMVVSYLESELLAAKSRYLEWRLARGAGDGASATTVSQLEQTAIRQFARVVLNVANRTNSGGNVFEVIHQRILAPHVALITPDSQQAAPIAVSIDAGGFFTNNSGEGVRDAGWKWGLRVHVTGTTMFQVSDANPSEDGGVSVATIVGTYEQQLAMELPVHEYANCMNVDDCRNIFNRQLYNLGGDQEHGTVTIRVSMNPPSDVASEAATPDTEEDNVANDDDVDVEDLR